MTSKPDSFFTHLRQTKTYHIIVTADLEGGDEFDHTTLEEWRNEGFDVVFVPFGDGGAQFVRRLQGVADKVVGVSEAYGIVAFGNPSAPLLTSLRHLPRLAAIISYYPPELPSPNSTTLYPPSVSVMIHLCATSKINITRRPEVLGIQGKNIKRTSKRVDSGSGLGGGIQLGKVGVGEGKVRGYVYEDCEEGFAEHDLDVYHGVNAEIAFGRSLSCMREAMKVPAIDVEGIRDKFVDEVGSDPADERTGWNSGLPDGVSRINLPTLTGGFEREGLKEFYTNLFAPSAGFLRAELISRTVGSNQLVDEMVISFKHDRVVEWMLPRVPPTGRQVRIAVVSVVGIKGGKCVSERLYWDQASVLVQIGMLDPSLIPEGFKKGKEVKGKLRMPVVGGEQAQAVEEGEDWDGTVNGLVDGVANTTIS